MRRHDSLSGALATRAWFAAGERAYGSSVLLLCLAALLALSVLVAIGIGPVQIAPAVTWKILSSHVLRLLTGHESTGGWSGGQDTIVWLIRFPRVILGGLVGAGLALVGAVLQAVTRNSLADPHLLGVTSGATLGAVTVILYLGETIGIATLPIAAFAGALLAMFIVISVAMRHGRLNSDRLLLSGVAVSFFVMAMANLLLFLGDHRASSSVLFWMLGGLGLARWNLLTIPALVLAAGFVFLTATARSLNAVMAGDQTAATLGINVSALRIQAFVVASLMTGVMVAMSGSIGFVGLMIPHIARRLVGADHRRLLPVSALLGAIFLIWVDVAARTVIAPEDLPIGVATAAIGGVFFVWLMKRR
ncbi:MAG: iron ABC transporter permease [Pseudomonadota bacterium]|jgi:iron complex transport system permease protein|uniref:FecCD family ABC transporter permease n=1 Tax=Burkholderia sp. 4M9327F10 TaxID=2502223 RepID=UPI0010F7D404|nr:iron ABC transporter permease [Burkholderia sp. 4M9327F10]